MIPPCQTTMRGPLLIHHRVLTAGDKNNEKPGVDGGSSRTNSNSRHGGFYWVGRALFSEIARAGVVLLLSPEKWA